MAVRLLHIITQLELGGAQKNVLEILSHLPREKYDLHLISSPGLLDEEAARVADLRLTFLPFLRRQPNPLFDALAFLGLVSYLKKERIQIVHTHSSKAGILGRWAARLAGVPVIIHTVHGWGFREYLKSLLNDIYIFLERMTATITSQFIAVTENDIQKGLRCGIGTPDQYVLIPYGIDVRALRPDKNRVKELRLSLGLREDDKVVGMIACLKPQKNPVDFVRAAALILQKHPDTKFLLVGDGVLRPVIEQEVDKRGLKDCFFLLGWQKDVGSILALCDILVLTSLWEGLPVVFLEAMSFSKPLVANDVCGLNEILKDGVNGYLVKPGDVLGLSQKVNFLLENDAGRDRMGRFGKLIVSGDDYSCDAMVRRIDGLYEQGLKSCSTHS